MFSDDAIEIRRLLTEQLEQVLDVYFPGWVVGRGGRSAFPVPGVGSDKGSFEVFLAPYGRSQRGDWFRRSEGIGGDVINLIAYALSGNTHAYREAFSEARQFLGLKQDPKREHVKRVIKHLGSSKRDAEKSRVARGIAFRERTAREIWEKAKPILGTMAEGYLVQRGINFDVTLFPSLRCAELVYPYREISAPPVKYAALVAAVRNVDGEITAIWRIYLEAHNDGRVTKASVLKPKLGLGSAAGGAVWLGAPAEIVNVTEGIETALAVVGLTGGQTVAACLSTTGMMGFVPPPVAKKILIWPDGDNPRIQLRALTRQIRPSPGMQAALSLQERLRNEGIVVTIQKTPANGKDWLDYWNEATAAARGSETELDPAS